MFGLQLTIFQQATYLKLNHTYNLQIQQHITFLTLSLVRDQEGPLSSLLYIG